MNWWRRSSHGANNIILLVMLHEGMDGPLQLSLLTASEAECPSFDLAFYDNQSSPFLLAHLCSPGSALLQPRI